MINREMSSFIEEVENTLPQDNENILVAYGEFPNGKMISPGKKLYAITYNDQFDEHDMQYLESQIGDILHDVGVFAMNLAGVPLLCTLDSVLETIHRFAQLFAAHKVRFFVMPNREDRYVLPEMFAQHYGVEYGEIFQINNINALISMLSLPDIHAKKEKNGNMVISPEFQEYYKKFQVAQAKEYTFHKILGVGSFGFVVLVTEIANSKKWAFKILYRHEYQHILDFLEEANQLMHTHRYNPYTPECAEISFLLLDKKYTALYQKQEYREKSVTLKKKLKQLNKLPFAQTRYKRYLIAREAIIAVMHFATCGVHWDLKPSNIMIQETNDGYMCWLLDLGFSKEVDNAVHIHGLGTIPYIPPFEKQQWAKNPFFRDVFALYIVLFEICTGKEPFAGIQETEELEQAKLEQNIAGFATLEKSEEEFINKLKFMMDISLRHKPVSALLKKALRIVDNRITAIKREEKI